MIRARLDSFKLLAVCLCACALADEQTAARAADTGFVDKTLLDSDGEHRYVVYVPASYERTDRWPIILYLHGAGSSGADGRLQLIGGLAAVIRAEGDFPAIVVFPQCEDLDAPLLTRWQADSPDGRRALRILEQVERDYSVDSTRRILTGWSMGGYGAWSLAAEEPDRWSAVVAVSGGGDAERASRISAPVWAIHGAADRAIPPMRSQQMVEAVNRAGGQAVLTVLDSVSHDAWRHAFLSSSVREWMISASPGSPDASRLLDDTAGYLVGGQAEALDGEFRPALIMPRAISLRIGNDALRTIAYGAPGAIDPGMLAGKLDDQSFDFSAVGESFRVTLEDLSFHVTLERVLIETQETGVVRLRAGLHPLTIIIGSTHVHSATRAADAGPTTIRIGHRYPLWMDFSLRPTVVAGRLHLEIERADFRIADANWVVSPPEKVTVSGPDLTPELAETALVGGLYLRREQIEQHIRDALPGLLRNTENRLQPTSVDRIVSSVWPMPVFRPRLRILPEEVAVDGDGLSLVMSLEAAPFRGQQHPQKPNVTPPLGPHAAELGSDSGLQIGMSPAVLEALSGMFVEAHAAHIDVNDMPDPEFALLADRNELNRILPRLASVGSSIDVRTRLDLTAPLVVKRADVVGGMQYTSTGDHRPRPADALALARPGAPEMDTLAARFEIPQLAVTVLTRERGESTPWQPYADFDVRLTHQAELQLSRMGYQRRMARLSWSGEPQIQVDGGYVNDLGETDAAIDRAHLAKLVQDCWTAWTGGEAVIQEDVPDLVLGTSRLRIDAIDWRESVLVARYRTPETRITNSGPRQIDYAVRGPFSGWSERRQLKAGETDIYASPSGLNVRRFPQPVDSAIDVDVGGQLDLGAESR